MLDRQQTLLTIILMGLLAIILTACGGANRAGDAAPVREVVPTLAVTSEPVQPDVETVAETGPELEANTDNADTPPENQGAPVFTFTLTGGVIGFCDTLTVRASGDYALKPCDGDEQTGTVSPERLELLQTWQNDLSAFSMATEDNPDEADTLQSDLIFNGTGGTEADETQKQMIFDWVNGLLIQVRPQPVAAPPLPEPPEIGPDGLCPDVSRPAVLVANYDNPSSLFLIDPTSEQCDVPLPQPPFGRISTALGNIYFPVFDPEAKTVTVWQLTPSGETTPLEFTAVTIDLFGPYSFTVSADGSRIAWAQTAINFDVEPPEYSNSMWLANIDGAAQETIMAQVMNNEQRYVEPIRFDAVSGRLFYALQPDALGGTIFSYGGRFDNLYGFAAGQGEGELLFNCSTVGAELCIGDISPDGLSLVYTHPEQSVVNLFAIDSGQVTHTFTPPASNYVGPAVFNASGSVAFISGVLTEPDDEGVQTTSPGYISLIAPPYTDGPQTLLEGDNISAVWEWVTDDQLSYGRMDEERNIGTSLVTLTGQTTDLSPNFPLAVLK